MPEAHDSRYYRNQAARCRRLAKQADEPTAKALLALAEEYDDIATHLREQEG